MCEYPQRHRPAHPSPVERFNQPVVLMVTVSLRAPHAYHCLDNDAFHGMILDAWRRAPEWLPGLYVIMPDHLHLFCVPGGLNGMGIAMWCRKWKGLTTMMMGGSAWRWEAGCWDTQMRSAAHYDEKLSYVRMNPVRKNLVDRCGDWRYQGLLRPIEW